MTSSRPWHVASKDLAECRDLLGPNAAHVESFLRRLGEATLADLRAAVARRAGIDYAAENAAHVEGLGLAHRHGRLASLDAARLLAVHAAAGSIARAMVDATVERLRGTVGAAVDEAAILAAGHEEAGDLTHLLVEAAELTAEALALRDVLPPASFAAMTHAFAAIV